MIKPWHTLAFIGSVFSVIGGAAFLSGNNYLLSLNSTGIKFPALAELSAVPEPKKDISAILNLANQLDSAGVTSVDTATSKAPADSVKLNLSIQYKNQSCLQSFYASLSALPAGGGVRILHYGDSQIEADRISDYLRQKLQQQFGGKGPGLMSLMPLSATISNKLSATGASWDRYATYTSKDKRVTHKNYGVLASFTRFAPYRKTTDTLAVTEAVLQVTTTKGGGPLVGSYSKVKLFYGGAQSKTWCEFYDGVALNSADSLNAGGNFNIREYSVVPGSGQHKFIFKGKDSPDFYALSLEGQGGVMLDNIPLRGSSGTFFHLISDGQLKQFYDHLNVKCIILQFGGNTLPGIKDEAMAKNFGDYIRGQIAIVKRLAPQASILVIGPADMSIKKETEYVTYPMLEPLRDAIKQAAFDSNCAFFDMYDCMGGKNSMVSWVDQKLAASDYIHFSPQGARKIATLLYSALINDYNAYLKKK
ncbi:MAG: GDSL-type esterase/lipase family protein [Sediminibacterium sp.]|nr:GDSL-type esterase/lipase family protein [Sediminibacterium sp.]